MKLPLDLQDIVVIGGGINGVGIARDAAGRGLRVTLCEQWDLAAGTSSSSTKLIHGGLRYLEHGDFKLVREALTERAVLQKIASCMIRPVRFVLPHVEGMRPTWMLRFGLFIYDRLAGRSALPGSRAIDLRTHAAGDALIEELGRGFEYWDCAADDARLVVVNAVDACERGAHILTRTQVVATEHDGKTWSVGVRRDGGEIETIRARAVVNAAGPWVADVRKLHDGSALRRPVRLVKGSHIVTRRLYAGDQAYLFQGEDSRVVFAIPHERDFTLIGSTESPHESMRDEPRISDAERSYLIDSVNRYLRRRVTADDIVATYSGVRLLLDEAGKTASAISREYVLDLDVGSDRPPYQTVLGGKLTTYRALAEKAVDSLRSALGFARPAWTATQPLPGGDIDQADLPRFAEELRARFGWLDSDTLDRMLRAYGTRIDTILGSARRIEDLGGHIAHGLHAAELDYMLDNEFALTAEDVLWRRSRLGLRFDAAEVAELARRLGRAGVS